MLPSLALSLLLAVQAPDTVRLTFTEAVARARRENAEFVQQRLEFENADYSMASARAQRYLPRVDVGLTTPSYVSNLSTVRLADGSDIYVPVERRTVAAGLSVSQPLPTGGRLSIDSEVTALQQPLLEEDREFTGITSIGFRLDQEFFGINRSIRDFRLAKESHARAIARYADQERSLARRVMTAYFGLVKARKQAQLDSMMGERDAQRLSQMRQRIAGDQTGEIDSLKFELEVVRSSMSRTRSRYGVTRALAELNGVLGLPNGVVVVPDTAIVVEAFEADVEAGLRSAYANRQDLRLSEMSVDNRRAAVPDAERTSPITFSLASNLGFNGSSRASVLGRALSDAISGPER